VASVASKARHSDCNQILDDMFGHHVTFRSVIPNDKAEGPRGSTTFNFFPVDCTQSRKDPTIRKIILMKLLLSECKDNSGDFVLQLMIKYGLVVKLMKNNNVSPASSSSAVFSFGEVAYLAPALLPMSRATGYNWRSSFYLVFSTSDALSTSQTMDWNDISAYGFITNGLFERLIGKAVSWNQQTIDDSLEINVNDVYKDMAILSYGRQRFMLTNQIERNVIRIDVEGRTLLLSTNS
jgi:hypothetical protein